MEHPRRSLTNGKFKATIDCFLRRKLGNSLCMLSNWNSEHSKNEPEMTFGHLPRLEMRKPMAVHLAFLDFAPIGQT